MTYPYAHSVRNYRQGTVFLFDDIYDNTIKLENVVKVESGCVGTHIETHGHTDLYQLGIKYYGATEIFYNGKKLDYSDGTVLYLPKENSSDIKYSKTILRRGKGVCIFFDAVKPMPKESFALHLGNKT